KEGAEGNDNIRDNGDGTHTITGAVVKWDDTFKLGKNAVPVSATLKHGPATISVGGKDVTASLVGVGFTEQLKDIDTGKGNGPDLSDVIKDLRVVRKK